MISFENARKESLASTACWIAAVRAHENEREDRLFDDPWAALLVGQAGQVWQERMTDVWHSIDRMSIDYRLSLRWGHLGKKLGHPRLLVEMIVSERFVNKSADQQEVPTEIGIVIRTKFFDDFLLRATRVHQIPQVVILASGMDTRAYRLNWSKQTRLFEIDQPAVLQQKRQILSSFGRWPYPVVPRSVPNIPRTWLVTAIRSS